MLRLALLGACVGCSLVGAAEMSDAEKLQQALAAVNQAATAAHDLPSLETVASQMSLADQEALHEAVSQAQGNAPGGGGAAGAIRAQLDALNGSILGHDAIDQARQAVAGMAQASDPNPAQTFEQGPMGLLWAFWATDAPGTELLPAQLTRTVRVYPELVVHDQHLMRLSDWQAMLKYLSNLRDLIAHNDPLVDDVTEAQSKRQVRDAMSPRYLAAAQMAEVRRHGGYLIIEDMRPAIAWSVTELPSFVFVSPRGIVHRIAGVNANRDLTEWIGQCLNWEIENDATLRVREATLRRNAP